jgi:hypothetical protein
MHEGIASKIPAFYFSGIFTDGLDYDDKLNLAVWEENAKDYAITLRGLFEGNLLCPGHLKRISEHKDFETRLRGLIGNESIQVVAPGKFYVSVPSSRKIRQQVSRLFDDYGLLMKPSAHAADVAHMV